MHARPRQTEGRTDGRTDGRTSWQLRDDSMISVLVFTLLQHRITTIKSYLILVFMVSATTVVNQWSCCCNCNCKNRSDRCGNCCIICSQHSVNTMMYDWRAWLVAPSIGDDRSWRRGWWLLYAEVFDYKWQWLGSAGASVTGCTLAPHCCKAHVKINRKIENSATCKAVTPKNFSSKLCTRDYVGNDNCAHFGVNRYNGGFFPSRWNITPLWLFDCPVLFFFSGTHPELC